MALQYFKVVNAETKQTIDLLYGFDRLDVLKKVERNMNDYRTFNKAKIVQLVPATGGDLDDYTNALRQQSNNVYEAVGTAD